MSPHKRSRYSESDCLELLKDAPLGELMSEAHAARFVRQQENVVTFLVDTNPNYSNICSTRCRFCAFWRHEDDPDAERLSAEELASRIRPVAELGKVTVLLQGAHDPDVSLKDWIEYIRAIQAVGSDIHVHPFSPPEILFMAQQENKSAKEILEALWDEGIRTMPGGGAEVLCDRVRSEIAPAKCSADAWLSVMEQAHNIGYLTTATLMFGHLEKDEEIVEHLIRLRDLQDRTGRFLSFIPWSFKPGHSALSELVPDRTHPARYVRIIAVARLVLDNFPHVQSSWFSESETAGSLGLLAGADDFGGILLEENVLRTTGYQRQMTIEKVIELIRRSGFLPARRDSFFNILETYPS